MQGGDCSQDGGEGADDSLFSQFSSMSIGGSKSKAEEDTLTSPETSLCESAFAARLSASSPLPGHHSRLSPVPLPATLKRSDRPPPKPPFCIIYSPSGVDHNAPNTHRHDHANENVKYHQECSERLKLLCDPQRGILRQLEREDGCEFRESAAAAQIADVLRVHEHSYYEHVKGVCKAAVPRGRLDMDTSITAASWKASLETAGAAISAVDLVAHSAARGAFVAGRPPGHHAGPRGAVPSAGFHDHPDMCSSGFCLFNNVAIAAAYARYAYGNRRFRRPGSALLERIAIVDFDIHDGNGTADCIRNLVPHKEKLPLPESWAPREISSFAPWLNTNDAENVLFSSIHLFDGNDFYPGSGAASESTSNIINVPLDRIMTAKQKQNAQARHARGDPPTKQELALMQKGSDQFRKRVSEILIPTLDAFRPDLIFFSAGFDGHFLDFYHVLTEDDYAWLTEQVGSIAAKHAQGRMISLLEGGYHCVRTAPAAAKKVRPTPARAAKRTRKKTQKGAEYEKEVSSGSSPASLPPSASSSDAKTPPSTPPPGENEDAIAVVVGGLGTACLAHVSAMIRV